MQCSDSQTAAERTASLSGRFTWTGLALMIVSAPLVGLVFSRIGSMVQSYFSPSIIFSVLPGVFVGLTIVALSRFAQWGHRQTILLTAVLAAIVADAGAGGAGKTPAPRFNTLSALLAAASAVAVTIPAVRVPYCNQCGSWFRAVRNGKIDLPTSGRLAELLGVVPPDRARSPRYRLSACRGNCGPTRCELSWERSGGGVDLARVWIDERQRREVIAILDELNPNECEAASGE